MLIDSKVFASLRIWQNWFQLTLINWISKYYFKFTESLIYVILTFDICHSFDIHRFDLQYASFLDTVGSRYPDNETLLYMSFSINALFCLEPISTYIEDLDIGIKNEKLGLVIKTNSDDETPLSNLLSKTSSKMTVMYSFFK